MGARGCRRLASSLGVDHSRLFAASRMGCGRSCVISARSYSKH